MAASSKRVLVKLNSYMKESETQSSPPTQKKKIVNSKQIKGLSIRPDTLNVTD